MVASASSCAADANADNIRARALFLFFILTAILLNVAGIIPDRPSLTAVRKAPLHLQCAPCSRTFGHRGRVINKKCTRSCGGVVASATSCADDANAGSIRARGWARLLLDRRRDLVDYEPRATHSASGKTGGELEQQQHGDHHRHGPGQFHAHASDRAHL